MFDRWYESGRDSSPTVDEYQNIRQPKNADSFQARHYRPHNDESGRGKNQSFDEVVKLDVLYMDDSWTIWRAFESCSRPVKVVPEKKRRSRRLLRPHHVRKNELIQFISLVPRYSSNMVVLRPLLKLTNSNKMMKYPKYYVSAGEFSQIRGYSRYFRA